MDSVPKLVDNYLSGKLKLDDFITHHYPIDKINESFDVLHRGERQVLLDFYRMTCLDKFQLYQTSSASRRGPQGSARHWYIPWAVAYGKPPLSCTGGH